MFTYYIPYRTSFTNRGVYFPKVCSANETIAGPSSLSDKAEHVTMSLLTTTVQALSVFVGGSDMSRPSHRFRSDSCTEFPTTIVGTNKDSRSERVS